jgi:hypothetical protein
MDAHALYEEAAAALDRWVAENDPDGEMTLLDQIEAYSAAMAGNK